jgi:PTH1 family peptidyl-tRNA hydrolase
MAMNTTGVGLRRLSQILSFGHEQCILVYDDIDMPLGAVRARLSGGAGGHRGVASILEAFQSDAFRRVKVGVGQAGAKDRRVEYVLTRFDMAARLIVDQAVSNAVVRVLELVERTEAANHPNSRRVSRYQNGSG